MMKWDEFLGGILVGVAFGIMLGSAFGAGKPEKVTTGTAGFCTLLVVAGGTAARSGRRHNKPEPDGKTH